MRIKKLLAKLKVNVKPDWTNDGPNNPLWEYFRYQYTRSSTSINIDTDENSRQTQVDAANTQNKLESETRSDEGNN